jgi:hypothetical protein
MKRVIPLLAVLAALLWNRTAHASHFRYGTIGWAVPDPQAAPLTVRFTVTLGWRSDSLDGASLDFGDGSVDPYTQGAGIGGGLDAAGQAYTLLRYQTTHTYAAAGSHTAYLENCCRLGGVVAGSSGVFLVSARVDLSPGNTGAPVAAALPVIQLEAGGVRAATFAAFDPDGDPITCRFGLGSETGLTDAESVPTVPGSGAQPTLTMGANGCTEAWDLGAAVPGQRYVTHVVFESIHAGEISSSALDLITEIVSPKPPTCAGSGTFFAPVGQPFSATTVGTSALAGSEIMTVSGAPPGWSSTPPGGASGASPLVASFAWTPAPSDAGTTRIVLVSYGNSVGAGTIAGACSLLVAVPQCAGYGLPCSAGVGACQRPGVTVCAGPGITVCNAVAGVPQPETCDDVDDDCDGATDEGDPGGGLPCATEQIGVCAAGVTTCVAGAIACAPLVAPGAIEEACNGLDDDCDGLIDEGCESTASASASSSASTTAGAGGGSASSGVSSASSGGESGTSAASTSTGVGGSTASSSAAGSGGAQSTIATSTGDAASSSDATSTGDAASSGAGAGGAGGATPHHEPTRPLAPGCAEHPLDGSAPRAPWLAWGAILVHLLRQRRRREHRQ